MKKLQDLFEIDLKKTCYDDLMKCIWKFLPNKWEVSHHTFHVGYYLYRGRMNDRYDDPFSCEKDISYRTDIKQIKTYGRANKRRQPMWYGSFDYKLKHNKNSPIYKVIPAVYTIFAELKEWKKYKEHNGYLDYTIGRWKVIKDIELVRIMKEDDPMFKELEKIENESDRHKSIDINKFMAKEFSKEVDDGEDYNYKISAAFTEIITKLDFHGIIYPSIQIKPQGMTIQIKPQGMNIVLTPKAVDTCLQLHSAMCYEAYSKGNSKNYKIIHPEKKETIDLGINNSSFKWRRKWNEEDKNRYLAT